ncbi:MAG: ABC transporter ATP-binding protein [Thermoplasmata archaeon]|nr:ABC transporter ATP-binding protein [Thermoplasmata archaeon]
MRFGDFYAVRDISLEIGNGEYVTVLGPSGCGKTTLIKVIAGIWTPTEGKVYVDGQDVTGVPMEDRDVGYVFQNIALFPMMTLKDNVEYSPRVKDQGKARMEELSEEYLKLVGMFQRAGLLPDELSGGEQQKVAIARALASGSKMLMLDEPLSALDARVRVELRYELRRIVKKLGITVLHVTHDQEEAMSVSDRIVLMRYGSIAETGSPLEMYRRPKSVFAANFIGETNLLECTVSDWSKSGKTRVTLRGGREVRVSKTNFRPGDAVVVSVRPEHVYPANDGIHATVKSVVFVGTYWRVRTVAESSDYIQYNVPAEDEVPEVGDEVFLVLNKKMTVVFPRPEGGIEEEIRLE